MGSNKIAKLGPPVEEADQDFDENLDSLDVPQREESHDSMDSVVGGLEEDVDDEDVEAMDDYQDFDQEEIDEDEDEDEDLDDEGVPIANGRAISPSAIPFSTTASTTTIEVPSAALHPQKPTPYILDAGHLLIADPNPLSLPQSKNPTDVEGALTASARDAAQTLLSHLLTNCPIRTAPTTSTSSSGITMSLPPPEYALPREKKIPTPRPPTKWEQFAARKGIGKDKRKSGGAGDQLASTEGKMVYDEASGDWVPKWGYKGKNKRGEGDWLVEVDEKKERKTMEAADPRGASRAERMERMRRNERANRANDRRARKNAAG